jgi:hypothetical protein
MKLIKTTLATGIAAALALGVAGQANASVYASSSLKIQNFTVGITGLAANPIQSYEFTLTNTATLNGASSPVQTNTCSGTTPGSGCNTSPSLDAPAANAPGGTVIRANNDFSFFGPGTDTYSNADSVIYTSELGNGVPSSTAQIAESELQGNGAARSNAEITSNTGFSFTFLVSGTGSLSLSFEADPSLYAEINQLSFTSGAAQANMNASFSLTKNDGTSEINWRPNGTASNDCSVTGSVVSVTCAETNDNADLNQNISVTSNPATVSYSRSAGWSLMGVNVAGLTDGAWTLAFNGVTSTSVRTVPEPSVLALLGLAIAGMGAVTRRRKLV